MKWLPFFIFLIFSACKSGLSKPEASSKANAIDSSIIPVTDTVIAPVYSYDRVSDSIRIAKERDSFFAIRPVKVLISDKQGSNWSKLTALFIDTSLVQVDSLQINY